MQKEIIVSASNVDRAIEKALAQLAMDRDAVSVEVLEMGRKGFLGIGATDAKIKVTYEVPDEAPKPAPKAAQAAPASRPAAEKLDKAEKPARPRDEAPRLVKSAPKSESAPAQAAPAPRRAEKIDPAEKPRLVKPADPNAPRPERPARAPRAERLARPQPVEKPAAE